MAHQTHALPWNTLASHFKYTFSHTHEPHRKDIFPLQKENQEKEIDYFCRVFAQRVREFADTERAKFAPRETYRRRAQNWKTSDPEAAGGTNAPSGGPERRMVYPAAIRDRYFLTDHDDDSEERWRFKDFTPPLWQITDWTKVIYGSRIEYADVLKLLMMEASGMRPALTSEPRPDAAELKREAMESLLLLANHPGVNLLSFIELHHGHHFGLSRVSEEGVRSYVFLNLLAALEANGSDVTAPARDEKGGEVAGRRSYMDFLSYQYMLRSVAGTYDGDKQNLVHWDFYLPRTEHGWEHDDTSRDVLADREALAEYLKGVWRVLVIYDLVIREAGGDPNLERRCKFALNISFDMRMDMDDHSG